MVPDGADSRCRHISVHQSGFQDRPRRIRPGARTGFGDRPHYFLSHPARRDGRRTWPGANLRSGNSRTHSPVTKTGEWSDRSEEHTSELQSLAYLVCRLLLEKKNKTAACEMRT